MLKQMAKPQGWMCNFLPITLQLVCIQDTIPVNTLVAVEVSCTLPKCYFLQLLLDL